jgi:hypothetical protein
MEQLNRSIERKFSLSVDTWAVLIALAAALAVSLGILPHIPW